MYAMLLKACSLGLPAGALGACLFPNADDETGFAGTWSGTTNSGHPVGLLVSEDNVLTDLRMTIDVDVGNAICSGTFGAERDAAVAHGAVSYDGVLSNAAGSVQVKFAPSLTEDGGTGSHTTTSYSLVCGRSFIVGSTSGDDGTFTLSRWAADAGTDVTGDWVGSWTSSGYSGDLSFTVSQIGGTVSGTASFGGSRCMQLVSIEGTVVGSALAGSLGSADSISEFTAQVVGTAMNGEMEIVSGDCAGATVVFSANSR